MTVEQDEAIKAKDSANRALLGSFPAGPGPGFGCLTWVHRTEIAFILFTSPPTACVRY